MIKSFDIEISVSDNEKNMGLSLGYQFYAALLENLPDDFGSYIHDLQISPVNQYIYRKDDKYIWHINALDDRSIGEIEKFLKTTGRLTIRKYGLDISLGEYRASLIGSPEDFLRIAQNMGDETEILILTPCAFKSVGEYVFMPTSELIVKSLIQKWNGIFIDFQIEDEDGEGIAALCKGLKIYDFDIRTLGFYLKKIRMKGFKGKLVLKNELDGFRKDLLNALILFSSYSGLGIKTSLGMGAVSMVKQ